MSEWVVVVTERNVWPPQHGCDARIACMLKGWKACGFKVCLVGSSDTRIKEAAHLVDDLIVVEKGQSWDRCMDLDLFDYWTYMFPVADACEKHNAVAVVAEYVWMVSTLKCVPHGIVKVVDTHDMMHRRDDIYSKHGINPWIRVTKEEEAAILSQANIVVAIQEDEAILFREMMPGKKVVTAGHWVEKIERMPCDEMSNGVMFVGSNNPSNEHCLREFIETTWPKIMAEVPDASLRVYGKVAEMADFGAFEGIVPVGFVSTLDPAYACAKVVVNPIVLGTGLKIKTVEALAKGKAVVCTSEGCAGMPIDGEAFQMRNGKDAFASAVIDLLKDGTGRRALEERAFTYAKKHLSIEAVMGGLADEVRRMSPAGRDKWLTVKRKSRTPALYHTMGDLLIKRAVDFWMKAAQMGNVQCMKNMAWACGAGIGVKVDAQEAKRWDAMSKLDFRSDPKIGQDKWVVDTLKGKMGGYFVDAGASDGIGGSNTHVLEKMFGWKGVCIEANREFFKTLRKNRSCTCENVCLSDHDGVEQFREAGYYGGIDRELKEHHKKDWEAGKVREVKAERLDTLLRRVGAPKTIDYLSMDLEGGEVAVLNQFPWEEWDIRLMTIERSCQEVVDLVLAAGFEIVHNDFCSDEVNWELHCVRK
jgi:succinoglycan biosynthesis protein ExoO